MLGGGPSSVGAAPSDWSKKPQSMQAMAPGNSDEPQAGQAVAPPLGGGAGTPGSVKPSDGVEEGGGGRGGGGAEGRAVPAAAPTVSRAGAGTVNGFWQRG